MRIGPFKALIFRLPLFACSILSAQNSRAVTAFDPLIGVRIGQVVTNSILASPPMPSIAGDRGEHVTPQGSYIKVKAENSDMNNSTVPAYSGNLEGSSFALGFTRDSQSRISYYGFATYAQTSGEIKQMPEGFGTNLTDLKNSSINLSTGISFRVCSSQDCPVALGFLAGPFISKHSSRLTATFVDTQNITSNNGQSNQYSSQSFVYGAMVGAQIYFKLGAIGLNPYFLSYKDLSSPCQTYETDAVIPEGQGWLDSAKSCNADNKEIYLDGSFTAYGLNLGYRKLLIGIFSKAQDRDDLASISVQRYTLSYTLDF